MKTNKKLFMCVSLMLAALLVSLSGIAAAEDMTLTIWATGSEDEAKVLGAGATFYMKEHPDVKIDVQPISWNDAHAKMLSATASGEGPDIITGGLSWGIEFGEMGGMVDLKEYEEIFANIEKTAHPQVMKSVTSPDGSVYGVPWDLTVYLMYYRPDILGEVGAPVPPKTWDEMIDAIKKLQAAGKSGFMMQWGNTQWLYYFNYLYQAGGTLYDDACEKATINSPEGIQALEFYANLYNEYGISTDGWPDLEGGLESGDLGFGVTGSWVAGQLDISRPAMAGKWKMGLLPAGPSGKNTAFIGGRIIGIMSFSKSPDVAADLIGTLYTDEAAAAMTAQAASLNILFIPPRVDFAEKIQAPAEWIDVITAQLNDAVGPPNCVGWEESARTVEQQIQEVIFNNADPAEALKIAAEAMESNLE